MEAIVLRWLKKEGDVLQEEDSIIEVATDKVDSEVPTPHAGKLQKILAQPGEVISIGAPIAILEKAAVNEATVAVKTTPAPLNEMPSSLANATAAQPPLVSSSAKVEYHSHTHGRFYSPLVRNIAAQEGVTPQELHQVPGTGSDNRVTKYDLLSYLQYRSSVATGTPPDASVPQATIAPEDQVIPMDRVRELIAARMVASKRTIPHVTSFVEADVTDLVRWRNEHKVAFEEKIGVRLTYTPLFLRAVVKALQDFPAINAYIMENKIVQKKAINLGVAVALSDGNLIVPVIKNASQRSLAELVQEVQSLAQKARENRLAADDVADGTYTVSNLGTFQNLMGTPIIMQPQVAILALGAVEKRPAVVESAEGDIVAVRHKMYLSHAYDHRVIDGALGGGFVKRVAQYLENIASLELSF